MKVNLNVPIKDFNGEPIIEKGKQVMMSEQVGVVLFRLGQDLNQEEMVTAYNIVKALQTNPNEIQLKSEDITFLKEKMAKVFTVGCYGQLYDILEQNNQ